MKKAEEPERVAPSLDLLARLGDLVEARLGLTFPPDRRREFRRGLEAAAQELRRPDAADPKDPAELAEPAALDALEDGLRASDPAVLAALAAHLTVGETYFFRERKILDLFASDILPTIVDARRRAGDRTLRLMSAGCCTGEEAYTLAIILRSRLPDPDRWDALVEGVDVNERFLAKARRGEYGPWSFRETPPEIADRWFTRTESGRLAVSSVLRAQVRFSRLNLAQAMPRPLQTRRQDAIFCRNVLMYFSPDRLASALRALADRLVDGGWLFVGLSETALVHSCRVFELEWRDGLSIYRKRSPTAAWAVPDAPVPNWAAAPPPGPAETAEPDVPPGQAPEEPGRELEQVRLLIETGRHEEAAGRLDELTGLALPAPWQGEALALRARVLADQGRLDDAARTCRLALDQNRLNVSGHLLLATIEQERGDLAAAAAALSRALFLDPDNALGHFSLGLLQTRQGLDRAAERSLLRASRLLRDQSPDAPVGGQDGLTAGRLALVVEDMLGRSARADGRWNP